MEMTIDDHIEQLKQMPISSEVSEEYLKRIGLSTEEVQKLMELHGAVTVDFEVRKSML